jgi:serine/threonine protein kinase
MRGPGLRSAGSLERGTVVGGYEVLGELCSGGMGQLYDVADTTLGRRAVLKVLHDRHRGRHDYEARLREEARLLAMLGDARVPAVFAIGEVRQGQPYFVMERLWGRDLRKELARLGVFSVPTAIRLAIDLLETLAVIHARSIVHRDIKPENLLLCDKGRLYLLDFGVARRTDFSLGLTRPGVAMGTLKWMAPEQIAGEDADDRSDVYAAGLVLFEILTGRGPFDHLGASAQALRIGHSTMTPPSASSCAPQVVPGAVESILAKALAKRARDRFASARAMADALRDASGYGSDEGPTFVDPSTFREGAA